MAMVIGPQIKDIHVLTHERRPCARYYTHYTHNQSKFVYRSFYIFIIESPVFIVTGHAESLGFDNLPQDKIIDHADDGISHLRQL